MYIIDIMYIISRFEDIFIKINEHLKIHNNIYIYIKRCIRLKIHNFNLNN